MIPLDVSPRKARNQIVRHVWTLFVLAVLNCYASRSSAMVPAAEME